MEKEDVIRALLDGKKINLSGYTSDSYIEYRHVDGGKRIIVWGGCYGFHLDAMPSLEDTIRFILSRDEWYLVPDKLEWQQTHEFSWRSDMYLINKYKNGYHVATDVGIFTNGDTFIGIYPTLELAKEQCQKHHEEHK